MRSYVEDYGEFLILLLFCSPIASAMFFMAGTVLESI